MAEVISRICELLSLGAPPIVPDVDNRMETFLQTVMGGVEKVVQRAEELDRSLSETRLRQVNLESQLKNLRHKSGEEQKEMNKLKGALEEASMRISALEGAMNEDNNEKSLMQADSEKATAEIEVLRARCERAEGEKIDLFRLVERRQVEIDSLNGQLEGVSTRIRELREEVLRRDTQVSEANGKIATVQRQMELARDEAERYRQQSEWNSQEMEQQLVEFNTYRKSKSGELAALQTQVESLQQNVATLEGQNRVLRATLEEKDSKMELLLRKNRDVEAALAEKESQFVQEMTAKSRLADLYKEGMEEATMRLEETEALLQAAQSTSGTVEARIRQARSEYEREIETLHSQLLNRDQEVNSGEGGRTGNRMLLADVYAEYAKTKGDLLQANQEIDRLKGCIQDICQDLEARVPVLQMERRDNERLKADISALSTQLLEASRARDELGARVRRSEDEARDAIKIHSSLEQQVKDLSKQIQALLGEMEGVVPPNDGVMDADQVIDERLVVFRNIQELQVRNQELVRVLRELSQQHETAELERLKQTEAEMRSVLEANVAELAELRETRQRQTTLLESLIRQRDMLRSMLEDKVSGAPSGVAQQEMASVLRPGTPAISASQDFASLAEVKAEYDMFKSEKAESERYLMGQLEQARTETSEMRSRHAQLTAQLAFGEERYALLKQNYEMERAELASLRKSNSSALESIMKHQTQVQQLMSELMATKETQQRVSSQLSSLRVELDMVRSSERRLITDLTCSQQEKERLTQLLAGLQALATEHESSDADLKQRLGQQIEFLERELHSARMKVVEEVEAHKLAVASADREYRELVRRYDQLMETHGRVKEEATASRSTITELTRKLTDLEGLHARSEERLAALMRPTTGTGEADLPRELAATRAKLEAVEDELRLEREHIGTFKEMARNAEEGLVDLNRTYDEYKRDADRHIQSLTRQTEELDGKLAAVTQRRTELEDEITRINNSFNVERTRLQEQLNELKQYEAMAQSHSSLRREDVERLQQLVEESRERYEQEVVAHGRDLENLNNIKAQLSTYQQQISELNNAYNEARSQVSLTEQVLGGERTQWEAERANTQRRLAELESQNGILLSQIESIAGHTTSFRRFSEINEQGAEDSEASAVTGGDLVEVVRYLRRQKDILQLEHDSMAMEYRRVKTQAEQLQRALDETRAVLVEERQSAQWQTQLAAEYSALQEKVAQLNIVRESNVTLRHETDSLASQARNLERQLQEARDQLVPKEEECRVLGAKIKASAEETRVIRDDRDHWKKRFDQLLAKYRVDPGEAEQLRNEVAELKMELDSIRNEKIKLEEQQLVTLNAQLEERAQQLEATTNRLSALETKFKSLLATSRQISKTRDELSKRVAELEAAAASTEKTEEQTATTEAMAAEITSLRLEITEKSAKLEKYSEAFKKIAKMKDQFKESQEQAESLTEQLRAAEERCNNIKSETELRSNALISSLQTKVKKLTAEIEQSKGGIGEKRLQAASSEQVEEAKRTRMEPVEKVPVETFVEEEPEVEFPSDPAREEAEAEPAEEEEDDDDDEEDDDEQEEEEVDEPITPELAAPMMGMDSEEDELMAGISDGEAAAPGPARNRVIDLSEISKRPAARLPVSMPAQSGRGVQGGRGNFRGRGQPALRRARRGGHQPE